MPSSDLTAKLRELDEAIDHLRITRKTLLQLADESDPALEPPAPAPMIPHHPTYQQSWLSPRTVET
jgi:hypothetical protein